MSIQNNAHTKNAHADTQQHTHPYTLALTRNTTHNGQIMKAMRTTSHRYMKIRTSANTQQSFAHVTYPHLYTIYSGQHLSQGGPYSQPRAIG